MRERLLRKRLLLLPEALLRHGDAAHLHETGILALLLALSAALCFWHTGFDTALHVVEAVRTLLEHTSAHAHRHRQNRARQPAGWT